MLDIEKFIFNFNARFNGEWILEYPKEIRYVCPKCGDERTFIKIRERKDSATYICYKCGEKVTLSRAEVEKAVEETEKKQLMGITDKIFEAWTLLRHAADEAYLTYRDTFLGMEIKDAYDHVTNVLKRAIYREETRYGIKRFPTI